MKFSAFKSMWENDGFTLIEHDKKVVDEVTWILFAAYSDDRRDDYGRHVGLTLALQGDEIVSHAMCNLHDSTNITKEVADWFNELIRGGIVV